MTCPDSEMKISRILDNELPGEEYGELFQHLGSCAACRRVFRQMQVLNESFGNISGGAMEPPRRSLPSRRTRSLRRLWGRRISVRMPVVAIAILVLTTVAALILGRPAQHDTVYIGRLETVVVTPDSSATFQTLEE
jgi:anti-sigma factor RsiW